MTTRGVRLAHAAARIGVRLRLAAPWLLAGAVASVLLGQLEDPRAARARSRFPWRRSSAATGVQRAGEVERSQLEAAHGHRRAGRSRRALEGYDRVIRATAARPIDRDSASYWHARLRLELGESTALLDLERLVGRTTDPRLIAYVATLVAREARRVQRDDTPVDGDSTGRSSTVDATRVIDAARRSLRVQADVMTEEGARAKRWSSWTERQVARIFSR